jgi:hypothetical protein
MPDKTERLTGPMITRAEAGQTAVSVVDEDERRVRLSFSSETPYLRESWFDDAWVEVLGHDASEIDMSRLATGGAPLLYNHLAHGRDNHIGVIEKAYIEDGRGVADVRFSKRSAVDDIWNDVKDGILTGVSVGYKIHERKLIEQNKQGPSTYRVTRWEPMEISMVPLAADPTVGVGRSEQTYKVFPTGGNSEITLSEVSAMPDDIRNDAEQQEQMPQPQAAERSVDADALRAEVLQAERKRANEIRTLGRRHNVAESVLDKIIDSGATMDQARAAMLDALASAEPEIRSHHPVVVGKSGTERFIDDAVDAIVARAGHGKLASGNQMRGFTLFELARRSLELAGVNTSSMDKMHLVGRAFTQSTSDFPVLLENAMHKVLQNAYALQTDTWSRFSAIGSVSDFRAHNRYRVGSLANIQLVNELGEFKNITIPDGEKSSISAQTKGGIINLSRQTIINDDLGAFLGYAAMLGRAARRTIETDVYALLAENAGLGPNMADGNPLFHSSRNNIGVSSDLSVEGIDGDRVVMAEQLDVGGNDYLDLRPQVLVVPIGLGGTARVVNDAQYDPDTANKLQRPNKVRGLFQDIVDTPRLSGTRRYLFANPSEAPVIEVAFLDGQQEPFLEMQDGFDVDGSRWKVRLDYGVGVIDFRGAVTNDGVGES